MKNTEYQLKAVDAYALRIALREQMGVDDVSILGGELTFTLSRHAMNGDGCFVGYEYFTGSLKIHAREDLGVCGLPYDLSPWIVFPDALEITEIVPAEEPFDYTEEDAREYLQYNDLEIDEDGDVLQQAFDSLMGEGDYMQPDDFFAYEELDCVLRAAVECLPEAQFDMSTRTWTLGDIVWTVP